MGTPVAATAVSFEAVVLIEVPQPWPAKIEEHPLLETAAPVAEELGVRIQGIVPARNPDEPRGGADQVKLVLYRRPPGPFTGYRSIEETVSVDVLANTVRGLWNQTATNDATVGSDVLICAHGKRDRCCGSAGTTLATHAAAEGIAVRRTSHLGGHRFAPTALLLPEGTAWAWLDDDLLDRIVNRTVEPSALRDHYRGSAGMDHRAAQLVETEAFFAQGWSWLDRPRSAHVVAETDDRWRVTVTDRRSSWSALVERTGRLPQPVCGAPLTEATKYDDILELTDLHRTGIA